MRIIILGPTASGKTELSLQLAEELGTSIISADSRQCFSMIDIGTAKPSKEELERIQHYNISNLSLDAEDSAIRFHRRAISWEEEILKHSDHIIYVGGSTLHIQGLIQPFHNIPDSNKDNITELTHRIEIEGIESLYNELKEIDPDYIPKMDGMNRQRIIRALDVWMQTGNPFSSFHNESALQPNTNTLIFGIDYPRERLYEHINLRVDRMIKSGLVQEVKTILDSGFSKNLQALQTVGYREIITHLEHTHSQEIMIEKIKTNSRRYAKRQLIWFRRWKFIHWLNAELLSAEEMKKEILSML